MTDEDELEAEGEPDTSAQVDAPSKSESGSNPGPVTEPLDVPPGELDIREPPRILLPVEVLEGQTVPKPLVEFLAPAEIVVLGYHLLPEQTPTEQASIQFEDRARAAVEDIAAVFTEEGRTVETRVVFTHDRDRTLERVAESVDATAVLLTNPTGDVSEVVVPLRGAVDEGRLADLVVSLAEPSGATVTLWALASEGEEPVAATRLKRAEDTVRDRGLDPARLRTETTVVANPLRAIVERSDEFDVVVMGEGRQTLLTSVLGDQTERVAEGAVAPVLVVRRSRPKPDAEPTDGANESAREE